MSNKKKKNQTLMAMGQRSGSGVPPAPFFQRWNLPLHREQKGAKQASVVVCVRVSASVCPHILFQFFDLGLLHKFESQKAEETEIETMNILCKSCLFVIVNTQPKSLEHWNHLVRGLISCSICFLMAK
jgi:hypothetical protein